MMLIVETTCPFCDGISYVEVNELDYYDWQEGKLAQDAFPYLSAGDRELLVSGICPLCWDRMFSIPDDEDEDDEQEEETWEIF